jgi:hypothetical protein
MSVSVVGDGDLYYFKQGAWVALRREPVERRAARSRTSSMDGDPYRVHTFTTSDDFVVTRGGEVEYLVVAGGGAQVRGSTVLFLARWARPLSAVVAVGHLRGATRRLGQAGREVLVVVGVLVFPEKTMQVGMARRVKETPEAKV